MDRRQTALSVFGVVQYRKREPRSSESETSTVSTSPLTSVMTPGADQGDDDGGTLSAPTPVKSSIEALKAVADELGVEQSVTATIEAQVRDEGVVEQTAKEQSDALAQDDSTETARQFDLRFWRCGNLLVVETAQANEAALDASPETKHRLVNNVFRTIFGATTSGAKMYTHSWPDAVDMRKKSDAAALEWLSLFLKGQKAKDPDTKLWLMGQDALELLLAEQGSPEELEGVRILYNKLDLEIYVTPSLDEMVAKPYLKAGVWKLLRILAR